MTKAEYIERYGLERYEQHNKYCAVLRNTRYKNDPEYRKSLITKDRARRQARYVKAGRIDLIENYEFALADNFDGWDIHHRLELHEDYINSKKHLKLMNMYYNRPPFELIWLRHSEHAQMHHEVRKRQTMK